MNASAVVMLVIGVIGLWGGVVVAALNYLRRSRLDADRDSDG